MERSLLPFVEWIEIGIKRIAKAGVQNNFGFFFQVTGLNVFLTGRLPPPDFAWDNISDEPDSGNAG